MSDLLRPEPPVAPSERARRALAAVGLARVLGALFTLAVAALAAAWLLKAPAPPVEASLPPARPLAAGAPAVATSAPPRSTTTAGDVVVQAAGAVVRPGVYRLPPGSRVADVVAAAGGVVPDADPGAVRLAAPVADGERVYVPRQGETPAVVPASAAGGSAAGGTTVASGPIDLNAATADQLDALPGVGPATAAAIVAHRDQHGSFTSVDGLLDVRGIGPAKLDGLRPLVTV